MAKKKADQLIPFCKREWKLLALITTLACLGTFAWGFHVLRDYDESRIEADFLGDESSQSIHNVGADVFNQVDSLNRKTVVSISGSGVANGQPQISSVASGVIINPDGYVMTVFHAISDIRKIAVQVRTLNGVKQYRAEIIKVAPSHDLALLKLLSNEVFPFMTIGDSQSLQPGAKVYAYGTQGPNLIIKRGVISRTGADLSIDENLLFTNMIQTDAVYVWSQTGGPLVNDRGTMVGLNIAVGRPGGEIVGYAVPSHIILAHFQDMVEFMTSMSGVAPNGAAVNQNRAAASRRVPNWEPQEMEMGVKVTAMRPVLQSILPSAKSQRGADDWWEMARVLIERQNTMLKPGFDLNGNRFTRGTRAFGLNVALKTGGVSPVDTAHTAGWRLLGYSIESIIGLFALGLVSGISGGMMTMGGGIIKVTGLMLFFGYGTILIRPVAYITNIFLYGGAALRYQRDNLITLEKVQRLIPWAMGGVVIGYFLGNYLGSRTIEYLLGVFALFLGIKILVEILQFYSGGEVEEGLKVEKPEKQSSTVLDRIVSQDGYISQDMIKDGLLGLPMGIVSGILGISGGVVEVPLQRYVAKIPLKNAIANSSVMVFFASFVGSIVAMIHGTSIGAFEWKTPIILALILIPGAYAGGMLGAWFTKVAPLNVLRWIYAILMIAIAIRMIF